jgi:hypothetical protein
VLLCVKTGHALRDATSSKCQNLFKKTRHLRHALGVKKNSANFEHAKADILEDKIIQTSSHDPPLKIREEKDTLMKSQSQNSLYLEDTQKSNLQSCKYNPIEAECSHSKETYHFVGFHEVISGKQDYGTDEYENKIYVAESNCFEEAKFYFSPKSAPMQGQELIDTLIDPSVTEPSYFTDLHNQNLQRESLGFWRETSSTFSRTNDHTGFNEVIFDASCYETDEVYTAFEDVTLDVYQVGETNYLPQESFVKPGKERNRNLMSTKSPFVQELQTISFKNNECNPANEATTSILHGSVENLNQIFVATLNDHKETQIPIQSESEIVNFKNWIIELPGQKSNLRQFPEGSMSSSSIQSEPCLRTNHCTRDSKNHSMLTFNEILSLQEINKISFIIL